MLIYRIVVKQGTYVGHYDFNNPEQALAFVEAVISNGHGDYKSYYADRKKPTAKMLFLTSEEVEAEKAEYEEKLKAELEAEAQAEKEAEADEG